MTSAAVRNTVFHVRAFGWVMVLGLLAACGRSASWTPGHDAGPEDEQEPGATEDAGLVAMDAGLLAIDAGLVAMDAGEDAGRRSDWTPFAPDFDAGTCPPLLHPLPPGLSASPRAEPWLELLVLHADPGRWIIDDATYARAARELALASASDAGPGGFIPSWGFALQLRFDAPVRLREYRDWDCLNWAWRARPSISSWTPTEDEWVFVEVEPMVSLPQLAQDYATLPRVREVAQNGFFIGALCGSNQDTCLSLEGERWRWLWYRQDSQCRTSWYRLITEADGGAQLEGWSHDDRLPTAWLDEAPTCWDQLFLASGRRDAGSP